MVLRCIQSHPKDRQHLCEILHEITKMKIKKKDGKWRLGLVMFPIPETSFFKIISPTFLFR